MKRRYMLAGAPMHPLLTMLFLAASCVVGYILYREGPLALALGAGIAAVLIVLIIVIRRNQLQIRKGMLLVGGILSPIGPKTSEEPVYIKYAKQQRYFIVPLRSIVKIYRVNDPAELRTVYRNRFFKHFGAQFMYAGEKPRLVCVETDKAFTTKGFPSSSMEGKNKIYFSIDRPDEFISEVKQEKRRQTGYQ